MKYLEKIRSFGGGRMLDGVIKGIEDGFFHKEIAESSYMYQKEVESGKRVIVGVNKFSIEEKERMETLKVDESVQREQIERLRELKRKRDYGRVKEKIDKLRNAAESGENLMHPIIESVRARATIGELCDTLREVFGTYKERSIF
jgi:methylmalonyl-CoA mutase N-terminal domain/subunit